MAKLVQIPTPPTVGTALPLDDAKRILNGARGTRLYAIYVLAATPGLRRGELLGLRRSDVDFEKATVRISETVQRVVGKLMLDAAKSDASDAGRPAAQGHSIGDTETPRPADKRTREG